MTIDFTQPFADALVKRLNADGSRAARAHHVREAVRQIEAAIGSEELVEVIATALIEANERSYASQKHLLEYIGANSRHAMSDSSRKPMTVQEWADTIEAFNRERELEAAEVSA